MAKVKFVLGATELQFEVNISYPASRPVRKVQNIDRTASGTLRVESYGVTVRTFPLNFVDITTTDYDNLVDFYDNTTNGALYSFTYYDEDGATHTVRFTDDTLDFSQTAVNRYSGNLNLEKV
jgi:hypothetical protein